MKYETLYTKYKFTKNELNIAKLIANAKDDIALEAKLDNMDANTKNTLYKMMLLFGGQPIAK